MKDGITILGHEVAVEIRPGPSPRPDRDAPALMEALREMARRIDAVDWDPDEAEGFRAIRRLVLFSRRVQLKGWRMTRSGCDEQAGVFYWSIREFAGHPDPAVHADILFHDGWHVVQHRRLGGYAPDEAEQVAREVDALERQIAVARKLGMADHKVVFLQGFRDDPERIAARLMEGVRKRARPG